MPVRDAELIERLGDLSDDLILMSEDDGPNPTRSGDGNSGRELHGFPLPVGDREMTHPAGAARKTGADASDVPALVCPQLHRRSVSSLVISLTAMVGTMTRWSAESPAAPGMVTHASRWSSVATATRPSSTSCSWTPQR
jgi:hypothetical protein